MVSCYYLNRFFIERLPARSGRFKLAPERTSGRAPSSLSSNSSNNNISSSKQPGSSKKGRNKENLEQPNEDFEAKLKRKFIKRLTWRARCRRDSFTLRVRCKRFARLDNELKLTNVLYATSSVMLLLLALSSCQVESASGHLSALTFSAAPTRHNSRTMALPFGPPPMLPSLGLDWRRISTNLLLGGFPRLPTRLPSTSDPTASSRFPAGQVEPMRRVLARVRQRMGARNTIRVHNAFRDFAWRVLGGLSMPTPVIYELRRQNIYPVEEDVLNDRYYNRNTSRTIRSKRLANLFKLPASSLTRRASKSDDDDDEPETFRERLRTRLDDMLALSRRSLFGRVVRLPSLFPFKRHEQEEEGDDRNDGATGKLKQSAATTAASSSATSQRPRLINLVARRKRRRELDRQIIEINGKRFYVDDDGELKELKESS